MKYKIIHLPKEKYKGYILDFHNVTDTYYDVEVKVDKEGFCVNMPLKKADSPITSTGEDHDFPDILYADHYPEAYAWGIVENDKVVAAIETNPENWSNRLRVTELWIDSAYQKKGIGKALMDVVKEQARLERRRAIILETQSRNVNAIGFYLHQGFTLIGLDTCCYGNQDIQNKEVRFEMGWFPEKKQHFMEKDVVVRKETESDYLNTEIMTKKAFWNKHHEGCDEHLLVRKLRHSHMYVPKISRIALIGDRVVGCIMYTRALIKTEQGEKEVLTFGPLCVEPEYQGCGIGEILLKHTMQLAKEAGYKAIIIYGEPTYYPRLGFQTCDHFGITTPDGKNFDAFMGIELVDGSLKDIHGKFYEADVYEDLPKDELEELEKEMPYLEKQKFPCQWN